MFGLVAGAALFALSIWPFQDARSEARSEMKDSCSCLDAAVRYQGWYGTVHTLDFENEGYLGAFVAANSRKVLSNARHH
jgi:hypothetical protein